MCRKLFFLIFLITVSLLGAGFKFVKIGTTGRSERISFTGISFPNGRENFFNSNNPIITGDNLYAPDLLRIGNQWYCYHGGWLSPGQAYDRIYLSVSDDMDPVGPWSPSSQLMVSEGDYIHVNDPTVQIVGGTWYMLYTAARYVGGNFTDWINYSTSANGINWTPNAGSTSTEITMNDPHNILSGGTFSDMARPSLVYDNGLWRLYFDAAVNNSVVHSYYAESSQSTPSSFDLIYGYPDNSGFPGFYEPDVAKRADGSFIAIFQRYFNELWLAFSNDGVNFSGNMKVLDADNPAFTRVKVSNPGLLYDQVDHVFMGSAFGMTDNINLVDHDIGFAYTQYQIYVRSPGNVWHVYAESHNLNEQSVMVSEYTNFDLVRLVDPVTGNILHEQAFTGAVVGDLWELQASGYELTASVVGGHGSISPTGGSYPDGTVVDLIATPEPGYKVKAWSGTDDDSRLSTDNIVTINGNKTVTVQFERCFLADFNFDCYVDMLDLAIFSEHWLE